MGSFQLIRRGLSDLAVRTSTLPKVDPRSKKVTAAQYGVQAPPHELQKVISEIAIDIHGSYVLKSSPDHPEHDKLRLLPFSSIFKLFSPKSIQCCAPSLGL